MHGQMKQNLKVTDRDVRDRAVERLAAHLPLSVNGYECTTEMVIDVLVKAAVTRTTVEAGCHDLEGVADSNTIRAYLNKQLQADNLQELERRVNAALVQDIPARVWGQAQDIAFDFHDEPFYGHTPEVEAFACRGEACAGTTRFYRVATAYVIVHHLRVTLALLFVQPEDTLSEVLACLVRRVHILGMEVKCLLLDKAFCTIPMMRYLEACGWPAILACPIRGKKGGTRALCHGRSSYPTYHTFHSQQYGSFTAPVTVVRTCTSGKRGPRRVQWLVFVVLNLHLTPKQVRRRYRRRFGADTSYRCMRQVRAWTTSRNPALRFLLIGLGFILVNLWIQLRWCFAQVPRRGRRRIDTKRFELQRMASFLNRAIEAIYGVVSYIEADAPPLGV